MTSVLDFANQRLESTGALSECLQRSDIPLDAGRLQEVVLRLPDFLELQRAIHGLFDASLAGETLPAEVVDRLNEVSARVPRVLTLEGATAREIPLAAGPAARTLATLAWSTIELVGGADRDRLRRCDACGDFFLAARSDRVWCSAACGNRVRVVRHRAKQRSAG